MKNKEDYNLLNEEEQRINFRSPANSINIMNRGPMFADNVKPLYTVAKQNLTPAADGQVLTMKYPVLYAISKTLMDSVLKYYAIIAVVILAMCSGESVLHQKMFDIV
jgi:hypothetical protein